LDNNKVEKNFINVDIFTTTIRLQKCKIAAECNAREVKKEDREAKK